MKFNRKTLDDKMDPLAELDELNNRMFVKPLTEEVRELIKYVRAQIEAKPNRQTQFLMILCYVDMVEQKANGLPINVDEIRSKLQAVRDSDLERYK